MFAAPQDLCGLTRATLIERARAQLPTGYGAAAAIHRRAQRDGIFDPTLEGLGPRAADAWRRAFELRLPDLIRKDSEPGEHGTPIEKAVLRLHDGLEIETVRIPIGDRRESQCISTQVGCRQACRFCETARMGLLRDLTPGEIVAQVIAARSLLGWKPETIVFQGMGEPLDNADALCQSLRVLTDSNGLGFAQDKLTVCTAGHIDGLRRLHQEGFRRLNLSLSLNAATDDQRTAIMPITRRWPLSELQAVLIDMRPRDNWQLGLHWCLMPGINDTSQDAKNLATFAAPLGRVMVHLIPYNPGLEPRSEPGSLRPPQPDRGFASVQNERRGNPGPTPLCPAPTEQQVETFVALLRAEGLPVRRRITKGRDVMAACGQLGNRELRQRRNSRSLHPQHRSEPSSDLETR